MILNASAENGSSSLGLRRVTRPPVRGRAPRAAARRAGEGRYQMIASSSGCTPLFLKAEPQSTGTPSFASVARRMRAPELLDRGLLLVDELLHEGLVVVGELLEQLVAGGRRPPRGTPRGCPRPSTPRPSRLPSSGAFISTRSMTPVKSASVPQGSCRTSGRRLEAVDDHVDRALEVGAGAVHLVHEADPRDVVAVGLAPDGLGLRLDAGDRVEHGDGAVEDPERTLDLDREVDVAGRVDDVDPVALPLSTWWRRR